VTKTENQKSLGVIYEMFRKQEYKPIGPKIEDFQSDKIKNNTAELFQKQKSLEELKSLLWEQIGPKIRPRAWRYFFRYIPLNSPNEEQILTKKRLEYQEYVEMNTEDKLSANNDTETMETNKLIKKDIHRTLPSSTIFRNTNIQNSLCRILLIYSIR
jgi:RecG-like helicase